MKKAFTLIELMVAMTLSLLLLLAVARMFRSVGDTVNDTQATLNMAANLNNTAMILREDLDAIFRCVQINKNNKMMDPNVSYNEDGYLEIIEGNNSPSIVSYVDEGNENEPDHTVGDVNDILMGTGKVTGANRAYRGLVNGNTVIESNYAEIIWFVRGTTLYRQTKLIIGNNPTLLAKYENVTDGLIDDDPEFHEKNDVSISRVTVDNNGTLVPKLLFNTLSSLARRENRFAHHYVGTRDFPFPHNSKYRDLRLPTMAELGGGFLQPDDIPEPRVPLQVDLWNNPNYAASAVVHNSSEQQKKLAQDTGWLAAGSRAGEDIVLTNVISFDIKVWNPVMNTFVDLGDNRLNDPNTPPSSFGSKGRYSQRENDD
ncbi:MAG: prepilin-type N-terminal cleavage/methylation domain-containing protein, partial [Planctomycetaceae bacterium]|nr:prepilin-type N-terminal cleavage/methylation domain-containing protein [Planctomycetaceae bacterium]